MNILVGYDGSNSAKDALKLAKDHAMALDYKVDAVTSMFGAKNNQYDDVRQAELGLEYAKALLEEDFTIIKIAMPNVRLRSISREKGQILTI